MNDGRIRRGPGSYARALEGALSRLRDRPVVLSPRDWSLVSDWYTREIPLALVIEALEEAAGRSRGPSGPRNLAYVSGAVEEAWRVILEGRSTSPETPSHLLPVVDRGRERWQAAAARESAAGDLAGLIQELLTRLDQGLPADEVDRLLDEGLILLTESPVASEIEKEVGRELEPFRGRMPPDVFEQTRRRAILDRIRRRFDLPRLALAGRPDGNEPSD